MWRRRPEVVDALSSRMRAERRDERVPEPHKESVQLDAETRAELRALGYIGE